MWMGWLVLPSWTCSEHVVDSHGKNTDWCDPFFQCNFSSKQSTFNYNVFSFLNFDYIQRWGWWVCGNRCTKWDLRPGQKHGLYWWVLFSLSLEPNVMVLDISEMICCVPFQVITWTRRGWNRVCTVTRGTTSPTCFLNTCPCKMCGHS